MSKANLHYSWYHRPLVQVWIHKIDPVTNRIIASYQAGDFFSSGQFTLSAGAVIGTASVNLSDPDGHILADPTTAPHSMDALSFLALNREGQWGVGWTGFLDTVHEIRDPGQGRFVQITATDPMKLYEVIRQSNGDVQALQYASQTGVPGSAILRFASDRTRADLPGPLLGLPEILGVQPPPPAPPTQQAGMVLQIDPLADSGIWNWNDLSAGLALDPQQQSWNAVLQPIVSSSGLEFFCDEWGRVVWRQPGYLLSIAPRPIQASDILSIDLSETDENVVTRVEVRFGNTPSIFNNAFWQGPPGMVTQLRQRVSLIYAPWLVGPNAAAALAQQIGQMYAANILIGVVVVPYDPLYQIGTLISLPENVQNPGGIYYVAAIQASVEWGGNWYMILGLKYGRSSTSTFPYTLQATYPNFGSPNQSPQNQTIVTTLPSDQTLYTLIARPGLAANVVLADPTLIPPGSVIQIGTAPKGGPIGPSLTGEYTVQAGTAGQGTVLYLQSITGSSGFGYVLYQNLAPLPSPVTTSPITGGALAVLPVNTTSQGTGDPGGGLLSIPLVIPTSAKNLCRAALNHALSRATGPGRPYYYSLGAGGPIGLDCSGLVFWAYNDVGYALPHFGPAGIHRFFSGKAVVEPITLDLAQDGDLLFFGVTPGVGLDDNGNSHVGFFHTNNGVPSLYSAMNEINGIGDFTPISAFHTLGTGFTGLAYVLSMQGLTLNS